MPVVAARIIIGGIVWVALGAQDTSCYIPFYAGVTDIPKSFSVGDHWVLNREAARWAFDYVDFHAQVAYNAAIADVRRPRRRGRTGPWPASRRSTRRPASCSRGSPADAARLTHRLCLNNAKNVVDAWWKLGDDLWVKYNHLMPLRRREEADRPDPHGQPRTGGTRPSGASTS